MRHDLAIAGEAFSLRPVTLEDSAFIAGLRNEPELARFINESSPDPQVQRGWLETYFKRPGDYYFIIEDRATGAAEGTISIYDRDEAAGTAEWGRWLLRPGSLAAVESVLLAYRIAFDRLGLEALYCRTISANESVVSFHDSSGLQRTRILPNHVTLRGVTHDSVEHRLTRSLWPEVEAALAPLASRTASLIARRRGR